MRCHLGADTIGFARVGTKRVVGVDPSENSLIHARRIAAKAGVDVEYVHANVYDPREAVGGVFDLVYTSLGVLCCLPDVDSWVKTVASLLKAGGAFFIRDDHPMFMTVGENVSAGLQIEQLYFERSVPLTWEDGISYVVAPGAPRITHTTNHQWNHSLGEIVAALIKAGLTIEEFEETAFSAWCPWSDLMIQIPDGRWQLQELKCLGFPGHDGIARRGS